MSGRAADGLGPGRLAALNGTEASAFCGATACQLVHPAQSCWQHSLGFFPEAYLRALPVYFPGAPAACSCAGAGGRGGRVRV